MWTLTSEFEMQQWMGHGAGWIILPIYLWPCTLRLDSNDFSTIIINTSYLSKVFKSQWDHWCCIKTSALLSFSHSLSLARVLSFPFSISHSSLSPSPSHLLTEWFYISRRNLFMSILCCTERVLNCSLSHGEFEYI